MGFVQSIRCATTHQDYDMVMGGQRTTLIFNFFFLQRRKLMWWLWSAVPQVPPLSLHWLNVSRSKKRNNVLGSDTALKSSYSTTTLLPALHHRRHQTSVHEGAMARHASTAFHAVLHQPHRVTHPETQQRRRMRRSGERLTMWWRGNAETS